MHMIEADSHELRQASAHSHRHTCMRTCMYMQAGRWQLAASQAAAVAERAQEQTKALELRMEQQAGKSKGQIAVS